MGKKGQIRMRRLVEKTSPERRALNASRREGHGRFWTKVDLQKRFQRKGRPPRSREYLTTSRPFFVVPLAGVAVDLRHTRH